MKIIKVPYSRKVQSRLDFLIQLIAMSGIALLILSILTLNWITFLVGAIMSIPTSIYLWKIMTLGILIWTKDFITLKGIDGIDDKGFTLSNNKKLTRIFWDQIKYFKLNRDNDLVVEQYEGKPIKVDQKYDRWYVLLKKIPPSKLKDLKIPDFIKRTFEDLKTCQVCGSMALRKEKCLSCKSSIFNDELKEEYSSEEDYIKEEQLELFCTDNKDEKVDFYNDEEDGFERDENWKPVVSEDEVIEYSKENYWDDKQ